MEKNQETQVQIDADILRCRADILRARKVVAEALKQESSDNISKSTKNKVEPTDKSSPQKVQGSQTQPEAKSKEPVKSEPELNPGEKEARAAVEVSQEQAKTARHTNATAEKAQQQVRAAKEKAEQEAKARAEAEEMVNAEQDLKAAAQKAQQQARAAREKAQQEAKAAVEKAEQEAKARAEAEEKVRSEAAARAKAQDLAKAAVEKAGAKTELEEVVVGQGRADKEVIGIEDLEDLTQTSATEDETDKTEAAGVTLQGGTDNKAEKEKEIPRFNLAQQILAEQRRIASGRRSKSTEPGRGTSIRPATGTIGRIIREAKKAPVGDNEAVEQGLHLSCGVYGVIDGFDNLKPTQQQVVADIVTSDISRLCVVDERRRDGL